jgi:hypothetical protein
MQYHPCGQSAVFPAVGVERFGEELASVFPVEVGLPVVSMDAGWTAAHDYTITSLVEHLRHRRIEHVLVAAAVEAHADVAHSQIVWVTRKSPWNTAGFVVQRDV